MAISYILCALHFRADPVIWYKRVHHTFSAILVLFSWNEMSSLFFCTSFFWYLFHVSFCDVNFTVRDRVRTKMERNILVDVNHPFIVKLHYGKFSSFFVVTWSNPYPTHTYTHTHTHLCMSVLLRTTLVPLLFLILANPWMPYRILKKQIIRRWETIIMLSDDKVVQISFISSNVKAYKPVETETHTLFLLCVSGARISV